MNTQVDVAVSLDKISKLSEVDLSAVREMFKAVYPPEEIGDWPGRHIEWAEFEWCARVWGYERELVSYIGIVLREASLDRRSVLVGGVGGVATHPEARR